jgi:hypothetical protein
VRVKDESRGGDQGFVEARMHMTTKAKGAAALDIAAIAASMAATARPPWGFARREWPEKNPKNNPRRMGAPCHHPNAGADALSPQPAKRLGRSTMTRARSPALRRAQNLKNNPTKRVAPLRSYYSWCCRRRAHAGRKRPMRSTMTRSRSPGLILTAAAARRAKFEEQPQAKNRARASGRGRPEARENFED